jgi:hypothetical protein
VAVFIDGYRLLVQKDLAAAIWRLQRLATDSLRLDLPVEYVWIDRICINQDDSSERSSQVALMGRIYSQSIRTLIWLGPESESSASAWNLIDHIYNVSKALHPDATALEDIPLKMYSAASHVACKLPEWNNEQWLNLRDLMQLGWFSRIWVLQEVVLSPQDPMILHGTIFYPWQRLGWVAAWMRRNGYIRLAEIAKEFHNVDTICYLRRTEIRWPLDALMSVTHTKFHATDQRDKVYSLLGLAAEYQDPSNFSKLLCPDYDLDVADVFMRVDQFYLERNPSLAILTSANGTRSSVSSKQRQHNLDLPSWAPDWSDYNVLNKDIRTSLSWVHYDNINMPARLGFPRQYCASAGLPMKPRKVLIESQTLSISGSMIMDKVVHTMPFQTTKSDTAIAIKLIPIVRKAIPLLKELALIPWAIQFIRTTTAEQHHLSGRTWSQSMKDGLSFLHELLVHDELEMSLFASRRETKRALDLLYELSSGGAPEEYTMLVRNFCFDRAFIITRKGKMGLAPSGTLVDDTVSILPGGDVPYIIRQKGLYWTWVGDSYIDGLMKGEAAQECHTYHTLSFQ